MDLYKFSKGNTPLLIDVPHAGTHIPDNLADRMTPEALRTPDTDWHQDRLYDFAHDMGASMLVATHSRFVVDLNRAPEDVSLYPGQDTEGLLPRKTGANEAIYLEGMEPDDAERDQRRETYHAPYHAKLAEALEDIKAEHGYAMLWDAHSIKSRIPRYFDGKLWDLNIGTNKGASCAPSIEEDLTRIAEAADSYTHKLNGRFIGGHITRHYGNPANSIHAVQLELSWATYMNEEHPYEYRDDLASGIRPVLQEFLKAMLRYKP